MVADLFGEVFGDVDGGLSGAVDLADIDPAEAEPVGDGLEAGAPVAGGASSGPVADDPAGGLGGSMAAGGHGAGPGVMSG